MFELWLAGTVATYIFLVLEGKRRGLDPVLFILVFASAYWFIFLPFYLVDRWLDKGDDGNRKKGPPT